MTCFKGSDDFLFRDFLTSGDVGVFREVGVSLLSEPISHADDFVGGTGLGVSVLSKDGSALPGCFGFFIGFITPNCSFIVATL